MSFFLVLRTEYVGLSKCMKRAGLGRCARHDGEATEFVYLAVQDPLKKKTLRRGCLYLSCAHTRRKNGSQLTRSELAFAGGHDCADQASNHLIEKPVGFGSNPDFSSANANLKPSQVPYRAGGLLWIPPVKGGERLEVVPTFKDRCRCTHRSDIEWLKDRPAVGARERIRIPELNVVFVNLPFSGEPRMEIQGHSSHGNNLDGL